ncbi:tail tube GTA-gp10-like protein [Tepidamorphus gemmatus]|jgi:hypothetical protein|uniref:Tail tube GTA-gp10-like protein n=1 Tax=Tepidamorphus gemmatus TaxID=747076 RepID=A0A4R3LQP2_9HYPH|nr:gene transfer agent family protein [Tepidamorphus gemmatus]TCT02823.1 tail tube GTA-gp10-like protein [Tepidamorphus gemmatus]
MANPLRGEIEAVIGGRPYTLCLTLGALAELEARLAAGDLMALAARFEAGRLSAAEALAVIAAGLRGGGNAVTDEEVALMRIEGGAAGYVRLVAALLMATFRPAGGSQGGGLPAEGASAGGLTSDPDRRP